MPSFLHDVEVSWGWTRLSDDERAIVRRHEALLAADRRSYTLVTAEQFLLAAAAELPGRSLGMRAADDDHVYTWQLVDGELYEGGEFDEAGMFPGELSAEDFRAAGVTIVLTPLAFPEAMLDEVTGRVEDSLSAVVQDAWQSAADELPPGFRTPSGPRRVAAVYLPVEIWADIKQRAEQEERSMSYLVQRAVTAAYALPVD